MVNGLLFGICSRRQRVRFVARDPQQCRSQSQGSVGHKPQGSVVALAIVYRTSRPTTRPLVFTPAPAALSLVVEGDDDPGVWHVLWRVVAATEHAMI